MTSSAPSPGPVVRPMGESALLAEVPDARAAVALYGRLRATAPDWVVELVPAARTVLLVFDRTRVAASQAASWLMTTAVPTAPSAPAGLAAPAAATVVATRMASVAPGEKEVPGEKDAHGRAEEVAADTPAGTPAHAPHATARGVLPVAAVPTEPVEILTRYDGLDLDEVAGLLGVDVDTLIRRHTGQVWTSAFIGFAPGFAYLMGEDDPLTVPRRVSPRTAVPAGSVALAAGFCGIYPRASPGGWHLIGSTDAPLWDPAREQPALLAPGTRVRFVRER